MTAAVRERALLFAALIGGWALASGRLVDRQLISDPAAVLGALWTLVASGRLWPNLAQTVMEIVSGYLIGGALGVAVAVLVAFHETAQRVLRWRPARDLVPAAAR